jgi:hypothetical protein
MTWWQRLHQRFHGHENFLLILLLILGGTAGGVTVARTVPGPPPLPSSPPVMACQITDQDGHIYHPERLQVLSSCITVTGTVVRILSEADGDDHIRVEPDTAYINLLRPANVNQSGCTNGCLVVEPVCEHGYPGGCGGCLSGGRRPSNAVAPGRSACMDGGPLRD